jgi:hypothetical protein
LSEDSDELKAEKDLEKSMVFEALSDSDMSLDFTTSSAISRVNIKFLAVYIPIFWVSGLAVSTYLYGITAQVEWDQGLNGIIALAMLPLNILAMYMIFILSCLLFSKLMLVFINLIHKPKEGIFKAEIRDTDYEFWMLRIELKKLVLWLIRNCPLPYIDALAFKWFGINMDYSSHMSDAWCDIEFIKLGRKVTVGQGAVVMSSMVVGKYLIIKKVVLEDYVVVGGHSTVAPGTFMGADTVLGALSSTTFNQILEDGWIYFGIPAIKLKPTKFKQKERDFIVKRDVDEEQSFEIKHEINIDEDKKDMV